MWSEVRVLPIWSRDLNKESYFAGRIIIGKGREASLDFVLIERRSRRDAKAAQPDKMRVDGIDDAGCFQRMLLRPLPTAQSRHDVFRERHSGFNDLPAGSDVLF